jgi:hypothetical protein
MKLAALGLVSLSLTACGGGGGLMHPAHTLPPNKVTMGAGVSSQFVLGDPETHIQSARTAMTDNAVTDSTEEQSYVNGAIAQVLLAPGLAPWVGARAGVGYTSDAGLTYTGRSVRLDGRHGFEAKDVAASIGLGVQGLLVHPGHDAPTDTTGGSDETIPGLDTGGVTGAGFDIPAIVGWRSTADLVQVWGGVRGGYEQLWGHVVLRINSDPSISEEDKASANRVFVLGVIGAALSISPVMVALELDGGYQHAEGSIDRPPDAANPQGHSVKAKMDGFTMTPTAALIGKF